MLVRILVYILGLFTVVFAAIWLILIQLRSWITRGQKQDSKQTNNSKHNPPNELPQLVQCARCKNYIPVDQAILAKDCYYCDRKCEPEPPPNP